MEDEAKDHRRNTCQICGKRVRSRGMHYSFDVFHGTSTFGGWREILLCEECGREEAKRLGLEDL